MGEAGEVRTTNQLVARERARERERWRLQYVSFFRQSVFYVFKLLPRHPTHPRGPAARYRPLIQPDAEKGDKERHTRSAHHRRSRARFRVWWGEGASCKC